MSIFRIPQSITPGYIRDKQLHKDYEQERRPRSNSIHPSSITRCSRRLVYDMTKDAPEPKLNKLFYDNLRRGVAGHYMEQGIVSCWDRAGILKEVHRKLDYQDRANGELDAILEYNDQQFVVEVKTVKASRFYMIKKLGRPEESMTMQLLYYMYRTNLPGWLYIECKNTQHYLEYFFPTYKIPMFSKVEDKIKLLNGHLDSSTLPDRERSMGSKDCKYCDWYKECW